MVNVTSTVTFRVDASQEVGLGHLRRCLTLAGELRSRGCQVRFVCREPFADSVASLVGPHPVLCIGDKVPSAAKKGSADEHSWDAEATLSVIGAGNPDASWVVVDSYRLGHVWERAVRRAGHRVMVIDDFRNRLHHADLLVSDSELPFDSRLNERADVARTLVGRQYTLIGPEYAYRNTSAVRRGGSLRLLVSYGGSDPTRETLKAIRAIDGLLQNEAARRLIGAVDVVVGHFNPLVKEITADALRIPNAFVHVAPEGLATLLRDADLFLTAGGNSMVEALALRKPCLVTVTADNQKLSVSQLAAEGMICSIGLQQVIGADEVAEAIMKTVTDLGVFAARVNSRPLFDHLGAKRISEVMLAPLVAENPIVARLHTAGRRPE